MKIEKLKRIKRSILRRKPRLFKMADWGRETSCGTACCIGGTALVQDGWRFKVYKGDFGEEVVVLDATGKQRNNHVETPAMKSLGLTRAQAKKLFYVDNWPEQFQNRSGSWNISQKKAAKRIDHFIATNGKE